MFVSMSLEGNRRQENSKPFEGLNVIAAEPKSPPSNWPPLDLDKLGPKPDLESFKTIESGTVRVSQYPFIYFQLFKTKYPEREEYFSAPLCTLERQDDGSYIFTKVKNSNEDTNKEIIFSAEEASQYRLTVGEPFNFGYKYKEDKAKPIPRTTGYLIVGPLKYREV